LAVPEFWCRRRIAAFSAGGGCVQLDRWSSGGPAEERHDGRVPNRLAPLSETKAVVCGGVLPNSPRRLIPARVAGTSGYKVKSPAWNAGVMPNCSLAHAACVVAPFSTAIAIAG
jgi:hypothetical protein